MDDRRLDELLGEAVGSAPPEDVVRAVSPWRHAMDQVLWGFALTSISLDFLLLNYILPSIGAALMLLGFRTLRANRHFRLAYYASMLRCALQLAALFLGGTVIRSEAADLVLTVLSAVFVLGVTLELYMGIMDAQAAAGLELRAPAAGWLMVWYILLYALGLLTAAGSIVGLLMLAAFIVILVSLVKLSKQLDEAGYAVEAAPVRLTDPAAGRAAGARRGGGRGPGAGVLQPLRHELAAAARARRGGRRCRGGAAGARLPRKRARGPRGQRRPPLRGCGAGALGHGHAQLPGRLRAAYHRRRRAAA